MMFAAMHGSDWGTFRTCCNVRLKSGMRTKAEVHRPLRQTTPRPPRSRAARRTVVTALTVLAPPRDRGLAGEDAIGSRPGNYFGNCRLNESPHAYRGGPLPCTFTHTATKADRDTRLDRWTRAPLVNRPRHRNRFGHLVDRPRLRLRGIADPLANGTRALVLCLGARKKFMAAAYGAPWITKAAWITSWITKTERRRSANLLRMPTGPMYKPR